MNPIKHRRSGAHRPSRMIAGVALTVAVLALAGYPAVLAQRDRGGGRWVGTWATAVMARLPVGQAGPEQAQNAQPPQGQSTPAAENAQPQQSQAQSPLNFANQTLRQIVRISIGGEQVRVVFSNTFGTAPLVIGAAHVALRDKEAAILTQSDRALTFSGSPTATIPSGAMIVSDPVRLAVPALADLAIDLYLPGDTAATNSPVTMH